jgi:dihydrofolate synthase/folylpolyglutamate synthase
MGLENIKVLLHYLGNPELYFPSIHIAGTNGEGSTASMIASILTASGYRTGLYTSPHLIDFSERIRVDGKKISQDAIVYYAKLLRPLIDRRKATFFEATTAIAFQYFADMQVDIAIIETGLGGRWDATNVITPVLSIITNIGLEHTQYLGDTVEKIAAEKAGIIKPFTPYITGATQPEAIKNIADVAHQNKTKLFRSGKTGMIRLRNQTIHGLTVDLTNDDQCIDNVFISLSGIHQLNNVRMVWDAISFLSSQEGFRKINSRRIRDGLSNIHLYSGFRGRLDVLQQTPLIVADVAHNADGITQLIASLRMLVPARCVLVFGVMKDKSYIPMIDSLSSIARCSCLVRPSTERALGADVLTREFHARSKFAIMSGSVSDGIEIALNEVNSNEFILVTGSHYVIGETLKKLGILL